MSFADFYPNVQCSRCGEWVDREDTIATPSWADYGMNYCCKPCVVIHRLEGDDEDVRHPTLRWADDMLRI